MTDREHIQQLKVDLAARGGAVKHGATGFLYGLGNDGIPSANMLAPLLPQVAAQKPQGGAQHPNGDALDVAHTYQSAGGREIQIYLQDDYANWPYEQLGLEDYLARVARITREVKDRPDRELFSFVPLNEPDQIWYNKDDRRQALLDDFRAISRTIKAVHPAARIVGPNFARYDFSFYREFLAFAWEHDCLPDVISWHELGDDFFAGWDERYADYRASESALGIPPREICINEYCRIKGDLSVPGRLVQWIARFENSKVDACLAYWTDAGSLNNLVTRDNYNKATGAWWLYHWYAGLSGEMRARRPARSHGPKVCRGWRPSTVGAARYASYAGAAAGRWKSSFPVLTPRRASGVRCTPLPGWRAPPAMRLPATRQSFLRVISPSARARSALSCRPWMKTMPAW